MSGWGFKEESDVTDIAFKPDKSEEDIEAMEGTNAVKGNYDHSSYIANLHVSSNETEWQNNLL